MTDKEIEEYKKNLSAKKIIFNQLNVEDCKNKYFNMMYYHFLNIVKKH